MVIECYGNQNIMCMEEEIRMMSMWPCQKVAMSLCFCFHFTTSSLHLYFLYAHLPKALDYFLLHDVFHMTADITFLLQMINGGQHENTNASLASVIFTHNVLYFICPNLYAIISQLYVYNFIYIFPISLAILLKYKPMTQYFLVMTVSQLYSFRFC